MKIAIIGLGWLGMPLAHHLIDQGYQVIGTKRNVDEEFESLNAPVKIFQYEINEREESQVIDEMLNWAQTVIFDIPPSSASRDVYLNHVHEIALKAESGGVKRTIFISSSSVFANSQTVVDEDTLALATVGSGLVLKEAEQIWRKILGTKSVIIRPGGLVGPNRHPARFLASRKDIKGQYHPVNLIFLDDLISIITKAAVQEDVLPVYHAVVPSHPVKRDYYSGMADILGLELPMFNDQDLSTGKLIESNKTLDSLKLKLAYDNPYQMV